jgi:small subunit ribosomal protein S3
MRPGIVIGRGGETIRDLATTLEENFNMSNPQISVSEIEVPEFNAHVVASRVASALQRGVHFRRAGFWALNQVMDAGALGAEIVISGKLRTERARFEKFRAGYFPRCGDSALKYMKKAEVHVQLKPGIIGVRVKIMPQDAQFPDKIKIADDLPPEIIEKEIAETEEIIEASAEQKVNEEKPPREPTKAAAKAEESVEAIEGVPAEETAGSEDEVEKETAEAAESPAGEMSAETIKKQAEEEEAIN